MASTIFKPLPDGSIRLLDLLPGEDDNLIQVELGAVDLTKTGEYDALSYTWGDFNDTRSILCNGQDFQITKNLHDALVRLRSPEQRRKLWIDKLCINQDLIPERTQQVRLMLEIYNNAKEVVIWTGDAVEDDDIELLFRVANNRYDYALEKQTLDKQPADFDDENKESKVPLLIYSDQIHVLKMIANVYEQIDAISVSSHPYPQATSMLLESMFGGAPSTDYTDKCLWLGMRKQSPDLDPEQSAVIMMMPDFDEKHVEKLAAHDWSNFEEFFRESLQPPEYDLSDIDLAKVNSALSKFCNRPYWYRAWIVQEILVSKTATLICGQHQVNLEAFCAVYALDRRTGIDVKNFVLDDLKFWHAADNTAVHQRMLSTGIPSSPKPSTSKGWGAMSQMSYHLKYQHKDNMTLGNLLSHYGSQLAHNPRDIIFSLVGALRHFSTQSEELKWCQDIIDYRSRPRDLYLHAAKHMVDTFKPYPEVVDSSPRHPHILELFRLSQRDGALGLPSWVPDWSVPREMIVFDTRNRHELGNIIPYNAYVNGDTLFTAGHIVDHITITTPAMQNSMSNDGFYDEIAYYEKLVVEQGLGEVYGDKSARFDAFWRTIIADNPLGTKDWADLSTGFQDAEEVRRWLIQARENYDRIKDLWSSRLKYRPEIGPALASLRKQVGSDVDPVHIAAILTAVIPPGELADAVHVIMKQPNDPHWYGIEARAELSRHKFIVTKKGYFGLAPLVVCEGDVVAILGGAGDPWFLRREGGYYKVVAHGFVHGLMYKHDEYYAAGWKEGDIKMIELR